MKQTCCGKTICPHLCTLGAHCAAGQQRSQVAFVAYSITLAQRRLARLQAKQLPLTYFGETKC